jgi:Tfp pilus assembly protein PilF
MNSWKKLLILLFTLALILLIVVLAGCTSTTTSKNTSPPKTTVVPTSQAQDFYNRGVDLLNEGKYQEAIAEFDKAIQLDPKYAKAYSNRGYAYTLIQQYDLGIADCTTAIQLDPGDATGYYNRGFAYLLTNKYDLSIADSTMVIKLHPEAMGAYTTRGLAYENNNQYDLAIADFNKVIESDPKDAFTYRFRGDAYFNIGQYDLAVADYDKAIEFDPENSGAWNGRGEALKALGRPEEAMESFNGALQADPSNKSAQKNKDDLIAAGIPDKGIPVSTSHVYTGGIEGPIMAIELQEGESFTTVLSVKNLKPPYRWHLLSRGVSTDVISYNTDWQEGNTIQVSGKATYLNDPTTTSRIGWVSFEVEDSSQPPQWGKGGFFVKVNQGKSKYDGNYSGMFVYWYREYITDAQGNRKLSDWKPKALAISLTLQSMMSEEAARASGLTYIPLQITHVQVNDPDFGTGLTGITPSLGSGATLPLDPTGTTPSPAGMGITISFPNGAILVTNDNPGALSVNRDVFITLQNSLTTAFQDQTWYAHVPPDNSVFADDFAEILYKSWILTKM